MDKITTLSQAIRYGSTFIGESFAFLFRNNEMDHFTCGCAVGTAYLAVINPTCSHFDGPQQVMQPLAKRFKVPLSVIERVSFMHYNGKLNRAQCADWLEARGY